MFDATGQADLGMLLRRCDHPCHTAAREVVDAAVEYTREFEEPTAEPGMPRYRKCSDAAYLTMKHVRALLAAEEESDE